MYQHIANPLQLSCGRPSTVKCQSKTKNVRVCEFKEPFLFFLLRPSKTKFYRDSCTWSLDVRQATSWWSLQYSLSTVPNADLKGSKTCGVIASSRGSRWMALVCCFQISSSLWFLSIEWPKGHKERAEFSFILLILILLSKVCASV